METAQVSIKRRMVKKYVRSIYIMCIYTCIYIYIYGGVYNEILLTKVKRRRPTTLENMVESYKHNDTWRKQDIKSTYLLIPHMKFKSKHKQSTVFQVMTAATWKGWVGGGVGSGGEHRQRGFWSTNNLSLNQGSHYTGVFKNSTLMCVLFWIIIMLIKIGKR